MAAILYDPMSAQFGLRAREPYGAHGTTQSHEDPHAERIDPIRARGARRRARHGIGVADAVTRAVGCTAAVCLLRGARLSRRAARRDLLCRALAGARCLGLSNDAAPRALRAAAAERHRTPTANSFDSAAPLSSATHRPA
jgi:hypothetical protein